MGKLRVRSADSLTASEKRDIRAFVRSGERKGRTVTGGHLTLDVPGVVVLTHGAGMLRSGTNSYVFVTKR